jgi:hypothetical protein
LYRQTGQSSYREAALNAAQFLANTAWDADGQVMPFEVEGDGSKYSYFFDTGIIVRGLLTVWRECRHPEILSTALKCADSMTHDFFDGSDFSPILELPANAPIPYEQARWSRSPGCYQLKAALAWYELWQITKRGPYLELYQRLLNANVATHDSFLPGSNNELSVMDRLHAYCYFLEGLLPSVEQAEYANALAAGIERTANFVKAISPKFLRSDVIAQLLRIRLFADVLGIFPLDKNAAQQEAFTLETFQSEDADLRLKGGFWFGRKEDKFLPHMNPVSTAFCYQALQMWSQYQVGDRQFEWQLVI